MGNCILTRRGGGAWVGIPNFTYTGTYETVDDGDGNWRIKFLTSGVFTLLRPSKLLIDIFCVGGGGAGQGNGGGGGYTALSKSIEIVSRTPYQVTVGSGGRANRTTSGISTNGGNTSAFDLSAQGGYSGGNRVGGYLGSGASGGGGRGNNGSGTGDTGRGGAGGSNGSNGTNGTGMNGYDGGRGQGTTTAEFHESGAQLYSAGGGGGGSRSGGAGGNPGGGAGAKSGGGNGRHATFYGSGGGGDPYFEGGNGYQGIAIIRNAREAAA